MITTTPNQNSRQRALDALDNAICTVTFEKLDGTLRTMKCTRYLGFIPAESHPKGAKAIKENVEVIRAFDIEEKGWRAFLLKNVTQFNYA